MLRWYDYFKGRDAVIKVGLVGAGRWGQTLARSVYRKSEHIRFVRGVTRTPSKVEDFAAEMGMTITDDYDALLASSDIDAVVLATPHSQHFEQILKAANAGKHIFVEKPLTLDAASAQAAYDAAREAGVLLALGHNRRCLPAFAHMRELVDKGELGQIIHVEGNFSGPSAFRQTPGDWRSSIDESPAGGMTGKGIHVSDMMISVLGPVFSVSTLSSRQVGSFGMDDTTHVTMRFASGQSGSLNTLTATPDDWRLQIYGTDAWIEIRDERSFKLRKRNGETHAIEFDEFDCEHAILELFAKSVETGQPWVVSETEAVANTALLEAIVQSIRNADGTQLNVAGPAQEL